jgi:hypothetical protein
MTCSKLLHGNSSDSSSPSNLWKILGGIITGTEPHLGVKSHRSLTNDVDIIHCDRPTDRTDQSNGGL